MATSTWSSTEDQLLLIEVNRILSLPGCVSRINWKAVRDSAPGLAARTSRACRTRYTCYLDPTVNRGSMTLLEQQLIVHLHATRYGNKWKHISSHVAGRSASQVKHAYKATQRDPSFAVPHGFDAAAVEAEVARLYHRTLQSKNANTSRSGTTHGTISSGTSSTTATAAVATSSGDSTSLKRPVDTTVDTALVIDMSFATIPTAAAKRARISSTATSATSAPSDPTLPAPTSSRVGVDINSIDSELGDCTLEEIDGMLAELDSCALDESSCPGHPGAAEPGRCLSAGDLDDIMLSGWPCSCA